MGIDLETLLILAVLAFILFGPEKLPEYAATLGKFVAKMRQATSEMTRQYQDQNPFRVPPGADPAAGPGIRLPLLPANRDPGFRLLPQMRPASQGRSLPAAAPAAGADGQAEPPPAPEPMQVADPRIRPLHDEEIDAALAIINQAALAYKGVIPADCWQEPYMPEAELRAEIADGVDFWGYEDEGRLLGVMGRQDLVGRDPHPPRLRGPRGPTPGRGGPPVNPSPGTGIPGPVLVGTWAAAWWAIRFYEKHGFKLVTQEEKDRLLRTYWTISPRQVETSVVLADPKWLASGAHAG